jgi:hypothetical protein
MNRLINHVRANAIAYVALFFAIGGGGAATAIAATATSSSTIHACVSKSTGALYVAKHCAGSEHALSFNQRGPTGPVGPTGVVAYGQVSGVGTVLSAKGMTITETATGEYTVLITASACKKDNDEIPVVSAVGLGAEPQVGGYEPPPGQTNVQPVVDAVPYGHGFHVSAGYLQSDGTFVPTPQGFNVLDVCGNYSS